MVKVGNGYVTLGIDIVTAMSNIVKKTLANWRDSFLKAVNNAPYGG